MFSCEKVRCFFDSTEAQNGLKSYWMNMIIRFYTKLWSSIASVIKVDGTNYEDMLTFNVICLLTLLFW